MKRKPAAPPDWRDEARKMVEENERLRAQNLGLRQTLEALRFALNVSTCAAEPALTLIDRTLKICEEQDVQTTVHDE